MTEQKKVGHAQHLKAVNNPIRREMLRIVNAKEQISEADLLDDLKEEGVLDDLNMFNYHMSFLTQALCVEKLEIEGATFYKILSGGKVVENF